LPQAKQFRLADIAELLGARLEGDGEIIISSLSPLSSAGEGQLSFLSNPVYVPQLKSCQASAVILAEKFADSFLGNRLISDNPYVTFAYATQLFAREDTPVALRHPSAVISESATIAEDVNIEANVVIGDGVTIGKGASIGAGSYVGRDCHIGENVRIYPNVVLYHEVTLGDRVVIHSASVIGADGFGFAFDGERSVKIAQLGGVRIGNDVEIGAASTIDRGALLDTIIGEGVKIDNHVQIGHNCVIGKHTIICGCAALAGSVTVGEYCIFGGGSGAVGHITVADRVQVSAMALLSKSVTEAGMISSGTLASPTPEWKRNALRFQQLDNIAKRLKELERKGD